MLGYRRLPADGIPNLRDLGGYAIPGGMTRYGVFLRSALPGAVTERDRELLRRYGLGMVIDFRSEQEAGRVPDPLRDMAGIRYVQLPMFDEAAAGAALHIAPGSRFSWPEHYIRMSGQQTGWTAAVMRALAEAPGCALFHCTTGKDRAGIISALLLSLCGVSEEDIIADYCISEVYLRKRYAEMERHKPLCAGDLDADFYRTAPGTMRAFLGHITGRYGSAEAYLRRCGLTEAELGRLREKLCGQI